MRSATRAFAAFCITGLSLPAQADGLREEVLRRSAQEAGLTRAEETHVRVDPVMAAAGKLLFQSKSMSMDRQTACASCHLDQFGSADGLPNAFGTKASGRGVERLLGGGDIIPRNTLPFWGRGGKGFDVLFWDGKVDASSGPILSQFAGSAPADDPLVVAVHLPPVEVGEMISNIQENLHLQTESVSSAEAVYSMLKERVVADGKLGAALSEALGVDRKDITFDNIANALAAFIRDNFKLQTTRFHEFVFDGGELTEDEVAGGLIFYGKGRCSVCHHGPYFTDFDFHAIAFPQAGFGKNGFGVDYGRFNVTMDPSDRYKFRTPPLYNVTQTAPYSHSGSIYELPDAIRAHIDPLAVYDPRITNGVQRAEFYERLKSWAAEPISGVYLAEAEIHNLIAFLGALEMSSAEPVVETE